MVCDCLFCQFGEYYEHHDPIQTITLICLWIVYVGMAEVTQEADVVEVKETVTVGTHNATIKARVTGEYDDLADSVEIRGTFMGIPYSGELQIAVPKSNDDGSYILKFENGIGTSVSVGDAVMTTVSKLYVSDEFGDVLFNEIGEPSMSERRDKAQRQSIITSVKYMSDSDEEFRNEIAEAIDAEVNDQ